MKWSTLTRMEIASFPDLEASSVAKSKSAIRKKSLRKVTAILDAFKCGTREVAEFWIKLKGRQIYIRYFPVKDKNGKYLGTLEVSQDITAIKEIEGEKRLLDWK